MCGPLKRCAIYASTSPFSQRRRPRPSRCRRERDRTKPIIADKRPPSPLDSIQPGGWLAEYTTDLLDLLNVLGRLIALEPAQADLLERICAAHLITQDELEKSGVLTAPDNNAGSPTLNVKATKKDEQSAGE